MEQAPESRPQPEVSSTTKESSGSNDVIIITDNDDEVVEIFDKPTYAGVHSTKVKTPESNSTPTAVDKSKSIQKGSPIKSTEMDQQIPPISTLEDQFKSIKTGSPIKPTETNNQVPPIPTVSSQVQLKSIQKKFLITSSEANKQVPQIPTIENQLKNIQKRFPSMFTETNKQISPISTIEDKLKSNRKGSPINSTDTNNQGPPIPTIEDKLKSSQNGSPINSTESNNQVTPIPTIEELLKSIQKGSPVSIDPNKQVPPTSRAEYNLENIESGTTKFTDAKEQIAPISPVKDKSSNVGTETPKKFIETFKQVSPLAVEDSVQNITELLEDNLESPKPDPNFDAAVVPETSDGDTNINKGRDTTDTPTEIESLPESTSTTESNDREYSTKSISRELKSLIKSAKDSKIISECTQITTKIRKSRGQDSSCSSLNSSMEADKIHGVRRGSTNSQLSNSSERSEKSTVRSMRSQNPDFITKHKQFLNSVTAKLKDGDSVSEADSGDEVKNLQMQSSPKTIKKKRQSIPKQAPDNGSKLRADPYCWRCHWSIDPVSNEKVPAHCTVCPRSYHFKCLNTNERTKLSTDVSWVCPECMTILYVENSENRSHTMRKISLGMLCDLLKYALDRMCDVNGVEPFMSPVDRIMFPDYDKYVVHPMDLSVMKENIGNSFYGSTEAFISDTMWILHNSIIFNTLQSKLTAAARMLVRSCRAEMGEIEACPECYAAAHARRPTWFTDVCSTPHILLWAKLKGFPYWPAKGMSMNNNGLVDVRFFGAHDRAWVPSRDCFLYSLKDPNNFRTKRQDILDSMQEAEEHIRNIARKFGKFVHAEFKTQLEPSKLDEQLKRMIPGYEGEVTTYMKPAEKVRSNVNSPAAGCKVKRRSNSKSSKDSFLDGDASDDDVSPVLSKRKMADGAEIARESSSDRDKRAKSVDEDTEKTEKESSRKRRKSALQEAAGLDNAKKRRLLTSPEVVDRLKQTDDNAKTKSPIKNDNSNGKSHFSPKLASDKEILKAVKLREQPKTPADDKDSFNKTGKAIEFKIKTENKDLTPPTTKEKTKSTSSTPKIVKDSTPKSSKDSPRSSKDSPRSSKDSPRSSKDSTRSSKDSPRSSKDSPKSSKDSPRSSKYASKKPKEVLKVKSRLRKSSKTDKSLVTTDKNNEMKKRNSTDKAKTAEVEDTTEDKALDKPQLEPSTSYPKTSNEKSALKSAKDRILFDDDTSLALLARQVVDNALNSLPGFPTISNVRSLSSAVSSQNGTNTKDTVSTLRPDSDIPPLGRVGVRSFARIVNPAPEQQSTSNSNELVQVEVKAEPMDLDDAERQSEKIDLLNTFKLRPVTTNIQNLREMRINRVTAGAARKIASKSPEIRPRAKKTFPQPKKPEEGRSELNSKNSMVYIPIQPPVSQAPVRPSLKPPARVNGPVVSQSLLQRPLISCSSVVTSQMSMVNTLTTPVMAVSSTSTSSPAMSASVHTVPLITTVNGQWTLALQPMMSVGNLDINSQQPSPLVNGITASTSTVNIPPTVTTDTNNSIGELPRLLQRPSLLNPLDPATPIGEMPTPSGAGQVTAKLNQNAVKLADYFRNLLEDSIEHLDVPAAQVTQIKLQLEHTRWRHQQEIAELKHNHELMMSELRGAMEKEKMRLVNETRRTCQMELEVAVGHAKSKQWCASCRQEAQFYCCWNTSYCDYPCQRAHWTHHYSVCTQQRSQDNGKDGRPNMLEKRLQPPEVVPKSTTLTVGGKTVSARVINHAGNPPKPSFIVNVVDESPSSSAVKCLSSYKPPAVTPSPLILNNQLRSADESSKKVVTSGGYLIVGTAPQGTPPVVLN